ncbi:MAG: minor capsid protein, partial [Lachnospiraceae bacterium]|nr:minor capsid protein [Lachnospiraceae bacterium]
MSKKDNEYWANRRAQMMYEQMELAEKAADEISSQYYKVAKYIDKKLSDSYGRVITRLGISDKDILAVIEKAGTTSYDDILRVARNKGLTELVQYLEQPGRKYRYERLIKKLEDVTGAIDNLKQAEELKTTAALQDIAQSTYYKSVYEIQSHVGLAFSFAEWDTKLFEKLANGKWLGSNYSSRLWANGDKLAATLKSELIQCFIAGKTQREVVSVIMKRFDSGAFDAWRLVRTEGCYMANEMEMQFYTECDIDKYLFVATLDLRTSKMCAELDGKTFLVKDAMPNVNMPPMHPFCRSTTIEYLNEETLKRLHRRARNPVTGKTEIVTAGMTYKDWYSKYVEGRLEKTAKSSTIKGVNAPDINNPKIQAAKDDFARKLANSNGLETHVSRMGLYEANTEYRLNEKSDVAFRYDMDADVIEYNPNAPYYEQYDMNYVQAHELSHRMDII